MSLRLKRTSAGSSRQRPLLTKRSSDGTTSEPLLRGWAAAARLAGRRRARSGATFATWWPCRRWSGATVLRCPPANRRQTGDVGVEGTVSPQPTPGARPTAGDGRADSGRGRRTSPSRGVRAGRPCGTQLQSLRLVRSRRDASPAVSFPAHGTGRHGSAPPHRVRPRRQAPDPCGAGRRLPPHGSRGNRRRDPRGRHWRDPGGRHPGVGCGSRPG
jgi:hypothetical protein